MEGETIPQALGRADGVTAEWLTSRLRASGALPRGSVVSVSERANDAFTSSSVHLRVEYSDEAPDAAPRALFLKRMDRGWGELEVAFYRVAARERSAGPIPRCWDAVYDDVSGDSHLLLDDLSATHRPAVERDTLLRGGGVPAREDLDAIMRGLGEFHARWWEDARIGARVPFLVRPWYADDPAFAAHAERRARELAEAEPHIRERAPKLVDALRRALDGLPALYEARTAPRVRSRRALTLSHGDCYLTHWLCARRAGGAAVLVDFDSVSANLPAFDLVYLIATFWTPRQRAAAEQRCLRAYHDALCASGVSGYPWSELVADYRAVLGFMVFDAVADVTRGSAPGYWEPKLRCLTAALSEWSSAE